MMCAIQMDAIQNCAIAVGNDVAIDRWCGSNAAIVACAQTQI